MVFGPNAKLGSFGQPVEPRVNQITIHHLLQHVGGGWANDANDPMYTHPELYYPSDLVKEVIATRPLDNAPGTVYAYSNFGYCVLGRVIEAALGSTYEYDVKTVSGDPTKDTLSGLDSLMWAIRDTVEIWNSDPL